MLVFPRKAKKEPYSAKGIYNRATRYASCWWDKSASLQLGGSGVTTVCGLQLTTDPHSLSTTSNCSLTGTLLKSVCAFLNVLVLWTSESQAFNHAGAKYVMAVRDPSSGRTSVRSNLAITLSCAYSCKLACLLRTSQVIKDLDLINRGHVVVFFANTKDQIAVCLSRTLLWGVIQRKWPAQLLFPTLCIPLFVSVVT